jgi:hypothetical protein
MSADNSDPSDNDTANEARRSDPTGGPPCDVDPILCEPAEVIPGEDDLDPHPVPRGMWIGGGNPPDLGSQLASAPGERATEPAYTGRQGNRSNGGRSDLAHPVTGQTLRAWLTMGLTVAVITVVLMGMVMRLPPGDFAQYVSPLTGLAGLALGYWFGTEKKS